jgi:hypothetical protein
MDTPFYAELVKKLTNPMKQKPYKESSVKPVYAYLKNLNGGMPPVSIDFLIDRPLVLTRLEKYAIGTQRSIVFAIRNIAKDFDRQDVLDVWKENIEETEAGKGLPPPQERSETQQKAYALLESDKKGDAWDVILKKVEELTDKNEKKDVEYKLHHSIIGPNPPHPAEVEFDGKKYTRKGDDRSEVYTTKDILVPNLDYIVPNLYTKFPPRRNLDYTEMKITTDYKPSLNMEYNYLVIGIEKGETAMRYVFNRYKTDGVYHQQVFDVPDDLVVILKKWITTTGKKDGDFLLSKVGRYTHERVKGEKLESDDITDILNRALGTGIASSMLRHMFLDKYNNPDKEGVIKEMMGDAEKMAHSITTQQKTYVKKKVVRVRVEK